MISRDCAGLPVEEQGCDTIDQGFDLLVEQMCLKYYYNSIEKGEGSVMVTDFLTYHYSRQVGKFLHTGNKMAD